MAEANNIPGSAAPPSGATAPYPYEAPVSQGLFDRAALVTPGGVNSPVRAFRAVGGTPRFMVSGTGPYLTDADGREYVDLVCSWGPMILGHSRPEVIAAVQDAVARGTSFGTPGEGEVALAEEIVARIAPVEQVRLVSSGTEATMSAIRLARGFTGRAKVIKFMRLLPRTRGRAARRRGFGCGDLRAAGHPGCDRRPGGRHHRRPVQRPRRRAGRVRRERGPGRLCHHRGVAGQHGRRAAARRLQPGPRGPVPRERRAVHLRRGHDRLPHVEGRAGTASTGWRPT